MSHFDLLGHYNRIEFYNSGNDYVGSLLFRGDQIQGKDKSCLTQGHHMNAAPLLQLNVDPAGMWTNWGEMRLLSFLWVTTGTGNIQLYCPDVWH